jgi:membrane-associated protein
LGIIGAILWVGSLVPAGWCFGNFPIVKENFELVVFGIIGVALLHMIVENGPVELGRKAKLSVSPD